MSVTLVGKPKNISTITVMCGVEGGNDPAYIKAAHDLGETAAKHKVRVITGGSSKGMMGAVGNGIIGHDGEIVGVMPNFLKEVEIPFEYAKIVWVKDFDERMRYFYDPEHTDGIVNLPGGMGTDHEHTTFATLDKHDQLGLPNILVNVNGFYDYRILDLRRRAEKGFLWQKPAARLFVANAVEEVLPMIRAFYAGETLQNIFSASVSVDLVRKTA